MRAGAARTCLIAAVTMACTMLAACASASTGSTSTGASTATVTLPGAPSSTATSTTASGTDGGGTSSATTSTSTGAEVNQATVLAVAIEAVGQPHANNGLGLPCEETFSTFSGVTVHGAPCPWTDRLRAGLLRARTEGVANLERSQFPWNLSSVTADAPVANSAVAHLVYTVDANYTSNRIDLLMIGDGAGGLLIDDVRCAGDGAASSIYANPPMLCYRPTN